MRASEHFRLWSIIIFSIFFSFISAASLAQEEAYILGDRDVFGELRRPPVTFPHEIHLDTLAVDECIICHHDKDENKGKMVYREGEEQSCKECHKVSKIEKMPGLREAFHGTCTVCHRTRIKQGELKTGPSTCGECHKRK